MHQEWRIDLPIQQQQQQHNNNGNINNNNNDKKNNTAYLLRNTKTSTLYCWEYLLQYL